MSLAQARKAIDSAYIEATTNANCIGLVKLMGYCPSFANCEKPILGSANSTLNCQGRHCGWIASTATIAASAH